MSEALPRRANWEHLQKQAKAMLRANLQKDAKAKLANAQREIARKYGFASWAKLKQAVLATKEVDPLKLARDAFESDDAATLAKLIREYPQLTEVVNQPI